MAFTSGNTQFGIGGFTQNNPFGISNNNNRTSTTGGGGGGGGGLFSFGVPTSFSGQSSTNSSSAASMFGTTSQFTSRPNPFSLGGQTSSNSSTSSSSFGTGPFAAFRPNNGNSFTTSQFGTSSCSTGQSSSNSCTTTLPFGTAPFSSKPTTNSFTKSPPFGIGPFSTGQTSTSSTVAPPRPFGQPNNSWTTSPFGQTSTSSTTTSPFTIAPPRPFTQTNNSWTTAPFGQTSTSTTTSPFTIGPPNPFSLTTNPSPFIPAPFSIQQTSNSPTTLPSGPAPFSFPQPSNPLTTSPTRFPSTNFPFTSSMISTTTTSPSNVSVFAPISGTTIQGTRQKAYQPTASKEFDGTLCKIQSISAMPCYENKSHEELRLEDYILTGKAGTTSTSTTTTTPKSQPVINPFSSSSFVPTTSYTYIKPTIQPISQPVINPFQKFDNPFSTTVPKPTTTTTTTTNIQPISQPVSSPFQKFDNPFSTTVPKPTTTTTTTPNIQPISQPVITPFQKFDYPFSTSQTVSTTVPNSATSVLQNTTVVPVTSISPWPVSPMTNPFATEVRDRDTLPIIKPFQYGISSLPVMYENPKPAQKTPLVSVRHLSMGRRRLPIEKYKPNEDEKRVPFFEELPGIYKKGSVLIPRENPRSWIVLSSEEQRLETELSELSVSDQSTDFCSQVDECVPKTELSKEIKHGDHRDPCIIDMIPKLRSPEYYMEPSTEDLAANELRRPGFCCKVKDFMIGRRNYGSIKFLGETDVRNLDVESIVQFANREVEVYKDEKDKPPVGQGLNKAAEITLLNIKCIDKSTGMHYIDGPRVDKFKNLLMSKAMKQGSEFVLYDPVKGEWRFKVEHF